MRRLLVVTPRPLAPELEHALRSRDWDLCLAAGSAAARVLPESEPTSVGLAILWPQAEDAELALLVDLARRMRRMRWVLAIDPSQIDRLEAFLDLGSESFYDYFSLPLEPERLAVVLGHAQGMADLERRLSVARASQAAARFGMIGDSAPMRALFEQIRRAADCDVPVLLLGETGTGKELAAKAIHEGSARARHRFVAVNCAAIPSTLIQAELFGYERGAFTGATESRPGYIETASGGTLFLDEVAELSREAQTSLLRCLEVGEVTRIGSTVPRKVDVRVVSATHADLESMVREQRFRLDLYYRLHVLRIRVPSLRERGEDIRTLAEHFLDDYCKRNPSRALGFGRAALIRLEQHDWPGNLRELRNRVQQAALGCRGRQIAPADLRLERRSERRDLVTLQQAREAGELQAIRGALRRTGRNLVRAAEELGVSRMTLYRLLQKHGLEREG